MKRKPVQVFTICSATCSRKRLLLLHKVSPSHLARDWLKYTPEAQLWQVKWVNWAGSLLVKVSLNLKKRNGKPHTHRDNYCQTNPENKKCWQELEKWESACRATMENSGVGLQKIKHKITILSSNSTSGNIHKRSEKGNLNKYLYTHVHSSIIHNS